MLQPDSVGAIISQYPAARGSEVKIPVKRGEHKDINISLSPMGNLVPFCKIVKRFYSPVRQNAYAAGYHDRIVEGGSQLLPHLPTISLSDVLLKPNTNP